MPRYRSGFQPETLSEFLDAYTVPTLKGLAGLLESNLPTRKAELIAIIQKCMKKTNSLRQLWERLDTLQKAAVAEVIHSPSSHFDASNFRAKYGKDPDWGRISRYGETQQASLLRLFIYDGEMPLDLKEQLKVFVPPPRAPEVRSEEMLPDTVIQSRNEYDDATNKRKIVNTTIPLIRCETERAAQHDLRAVLRLIDTGKVRVSEETKRVTAAGAKAITEVLQGGDFYPPEEKTDKYSTEPGPVKAFAWPLLLQSAGLANLSGSKLQLTPAGRKALTTPPHQVIRTIWSHWLKTTLLDEFNRINAVKGQTGKGKRGMTAVAGRRAPIVKTLKICPPNKWLAFDEFSRFMQASRNTFEVTHNLWTLYISDPQYGNLEYEGYGDWNILQGRYIMVFLFEYAATIGLIDVAYIHPSGARKDYYDIWGTDDLGWLSRYDGLLYIRINGLGAWCLGLAEEYVPLPLEVSHALKVLPNLDVVAVEPLPPGDVLFLEQFAERTSDVVWKIQPIRLLKALEEGHSVADIEAFLTAKSGSSLPDNVAIFFKDIADRASRLADRGPARLIEAADAVLAQLIVNDSRLRSLCILAGERYIVVPADSESAFRRALRELGYGLPVPKDNMRT